MEDSNPRKKQKIYRRLKNKFRLVVMNDDTFEVKFSMILSPLNVFTWSGLIVILIVTLVSVFIAFTPVRELIPGYADVNTRRIASYAALKADSLIQELELKNQYIQNIRAIMLGQSPGDFDSTQAIRSPGNIQSISNAPSKEDSMLRSRIESEDQYNLNFAQKNNTGSNISSVFFFTPLNGIVSSSFSLKDKHFGVDVIAPENEMIKAALDGTVILASWTSETGHVIQIQHQNNLVTVYKHNSVLLKEVGEKVKAGEAIAIIGNSGELTSGPHLHFELWNNGTPLDPQSFMIF